jgi:hypothetical protein
MLPTVARAIATGLSWATTLSSCLGQDVSVIKYVCQTVACSTVRELTSDTTGHALHATVTVHATTTVNAFVKQVGTTVKTGYNVLNRVPMPTVLQYVERTQNVKWSTARPNVFVERGSGTNQSVMSFAPV